MKNQCTNPPSTAPTKAKVQEHWDALNRGDINGEEFACIIATEFQLEPSPSTPPTTAPIELFKDAVRGWELVTTQEVMESEGTIQWVEPFVRGVAIYRGDGNNIVFRLPDLPGATPAPRSTVAPTVRYERAPALDRRMAHGDDYAGDAWVRWTVPGHVPDDADPRYLPSAIEDTTKEKP